MVDFTHVNLSQNSYAPCKPRKRKLSDSRLLKALWKNKSFRYTGLLPEVFMVIKINSVSVLSSENIYVKDLGKIFLGTFFPRKTCFVLWSLMKSFGKWRLKGHRNPVFPYTFIGLITFCYFFSVRGFRIGFNSLCAFASVNHLHLHAFYLNQEIPLDRVVSDLWFFVYTFTVENWW